MCVCVCEHTRVRVHESDFVEQDEEIAKGAGSERWKKYDSQPNNKRKQKIIINQQKL